MATKPQSKRNLKGGWLFLGTMVMIYGVTMLISDSLAKQSLILFGKVFVKVIPVLVLVFFLMVVFNLILTPERIKQYLGKASGVKGWLLAIVGGVFATGPIYTWYILLGELKQQGMKTTLVAAFLYSRAVKLPLLPLLVHYFGMSYTIILYLYLVIFSIVSGLTTGMLAENSNTTE